MREDLFVFITQTRFRTTLRLRQIDFFSALSHERAVRGEIKPTQWITQIFVMILRLSESGKW